MGCCNCNYGSTNSLEKHINKKAVIQHLYSGQCTSILLLQWEKHLRIAPHVQADGSACQDVHGKHEGVTWASIHIFCILQVLPVNLSIREDALTEAGMSGPAS